MREATKKASDLTKDQIESAVSKLTALCPVGRKQVQVMLEGFAGISSVEGPQAGEVWGWEGPCFVNFLILPGNKALRLDGTMPVISVKEMFDNHAKGIKRRGSFVDSRTINKFFEAL
jgi:hypothetical protein